MISETEVYSIINYLAEDITVEEKLRIEAKLAENPDFVAVFEQFKEKWEQTVKVSEIRQIDVKKEWTAFQNLRDIRQTQAHSTRIRRIPVLRYAVAASVLSVATLSSIWFLKLISGENAPKVEQVAFYTSLDKGEEKNVEVIEVHKKEVLVSIPKGQRRQLTLPDGTKVWLNSRSKLTYASDFNQETRDVVLEGEAYFNVAHDKSKPFHVKAKGVVIEVLGTIFNVSAYPEDEAVQTALISGRISMVDSVSDKMIYLQPKEAVRVDFKSGSTTKNGFDEDIYSSWKDGELVFADELPQKVFEKLERTFNKTFRFSPTIFDDKRLTAHFRKGETLEKILEVTAKALKVKIQESEKEVIISELPKASRY